MKRTRLPPALRSTINRTAHALAGLYELRQRRELTDSAIKQLLRGFVHFRSLRQDTEGTETKGASI